MGVIEASDRAWKVVQMTDEGHGAAEWLRGIIGRYKDEADGFSRGCSAMAKMFGIDCKEIGYADRTSGVHYDELDASSVRGTRWCDFKPIEEGDDD